MSSGGALRAEGSSYRRPSAAAPAPRRANAGGNVIGRGNKPKAWQQYRLVDGAAWRRMSRRLEMAENNPSSAAVGAPVMAYRPAANEAGYAPACQQRRPALACRHVAAAAAEGRARRCDKYIV